MYVLQCMYVCVYVCMYVFIYVCMYVCMYVYMYVCMCIHMYVCIYIVTYIHTCMVHPLALILMNKTPFSKRMEKAPLWTMTMLCGAFCKTKPPVLYHQYETRNLRPVAVTILGSNSQDYFTNKLSETENTCSGLLISNRHYFGSVEQIHLYLTSLN